MGKWNYEVAWKMAERNGTKGWICCSIKFLVKMKNVVFCFYLKTKGIFLPTQYIAGICMFSLHENGSMLNTLQYALHFSLIFYFFSIPRSFHSHVYRLTSLKKKTAIVLYKLHLVMMGSQKTLNEWLHIISFISL